MNKFLVQKGYQTIIVDDLSRGNKFSLKWGKFYQLDFGNKEEIKKILLENKIDLVMHLSAFAYVGESVSNPSLYYHNNVFKTTILLDSMIECGVNKFIFSSSCATFGNAQYLPINEKHPQIPVNPYGFTKLAVERILKDYEKAYGLKSIVLRYFNAAGADFDGEIGEYHHPETHLIPLILRSAKDSNHKLTVSGNQYDTKDGTCVRDYLHVWDIAQAHYLSMLDLYKTDTSNDFNLGLGYGYSILDIIKVTEKITGRNIPFTIGEIREGDPPELISSNSKIIEILGWKPKYKKIEEMIQSAWNWEMNSLPNYI